LYDGDGGEGEEEEGRVTEEDAPVDDDPAAADV
jgi:hypothetical protein